MKKPRSDSTHVESNLLANALMEIKPLATTPLSEEEMQFWPIIVSARHEWTDIDLLHAAQLARAMHAQEIETQLLKEEGTIIKGGRHGVTNITNPRVLVLAEITRRTIMLSQKLQVHAQATMGISRNQQKKNGKQKDLKAAFDSLEDARLIARPANA